MIYYAPAGDDWYWLAEYNNKNGGRLRWSLIPRDHRKETKRVPRSSVPKQVLKSAWYYLVETART
jgi:hypothetical protein